MSDLTGALGQLTWPLGQFTRNSMKNNEVSDLTGALGQFTRNRMKHNEVSDLTGTLGEFDRPWANLHENALKTTTCPI